MNTKSNAMWETLPNTADWDCFKTPIFAGDLEDSKISIKWSIVRFWKSYNSSTNWMCKKQTSVSHSSTESEIISLDAGLRLDGIPTLDSWDLIVFLLGNTTQNHDRKRKLVVCKLRITCKGNLEECSMI